MDKKDKKNLLENEEIQKKKNEKIKKNIVISLFVYMIFSYLIFILSFIVRMIPMISELRNIIFIFFHIYILTFLIGAPIIYFTFKKIKNYEDELEYQKLKEKIARNEIKNKEIEKDLKDERINKHN